jgi:phospholipase C
MGLPLPGVEPGRRRARPLDYLLAVEDRLRGEEIELGFANHGRLGAALQVYDLKDDGAAPRRYTLSPASELKDRWPIHNGAYDMLVHGPNGFSRRFQGDARAPLQAKLILGPRAALEFRNSRGVIQHISVRDRNSGKKSVHIVNGNARSRIEIDLASQDNWYNLEITGRAFLRCFSGKLETGRPGWSDPALM